MRISCWTWCGGGGGGASDVSCHGRAGIRPGVSGSPVQATPAALQSSTDPLTRGMAALAAALAAAALLAAWRLSSATAVENQTYDAMLKCQDELQLDDDTFKELVLKIPKEENEMSRCFLECTMKNLGLISYGEVDTKKLTKHLKNSIPLTEDFERRLVKNIQECNLKYAGGNCMKTYKIWKCIVEYL
ncbi:uncharacterized protein LOC134527685 [Bacillus rossius redtenbacheri]|uniref:uncharacterized protein LOC134527685 n=1 Tax=Bacillus rossius redtenbacheri TaxID=93214 RepID=UPI002FDE1FC3